MLSILGKLSVCRSTPGVVKSITAKSLLGSLSPLSTADQFVATSKKPSRPASEQHFSLPPSPAFINNRAAEYGVWKTALQDLQEKEKAKITTLQCMLDSLRVACLPTDALMQQRRDVYQVMNRNARKPKRANHGKRPCSRIKRRYQKKKWQNPSRRG